MRSIPFGKPIIGEEEHQAVRKVIESGTLVHGPVAKEFETRFRDFTKAPHAVSVASCTAALHLSYFYLGLGPGDEVIVPAQTHTATAHAVELCGAKPVFVDAERETGNIDIDQIEASITERTKALSIVHFLGMPVDMNRINSIASKHRLFVVEDCALAVGTYLDGKHAGLFGDVGCFSFYPVKLMTTGEGGMLTARDEALAQKIARQKAFGVDRTVGERKVPGVYDVTMLGFNYRMNEIAAAIGIEQLERVPEFLEKRQRNYQLLAGELREVSELSLLKSTSGRFVSSYYCLSILLNSALSKKRFEIVRHLNQKGVGTSVYYPKPVPHLHYYGEKYGYNERDFPVAAWVSYSSIALPVGPHLIEDDMLYIAETVKEAISKER